MVADRIKQVRKSLNLSQKDFGEALGVSRDVIGNLEYGRVEPKEPFTTHLCNIYGISREWLLTGTGEMTDENIETKKKINEAVKIFDTLDPELQDYAIQQMKALLEVQKSIKK